MSGLQVVPFKNNYELLRIQPKYDADKVRQFAMAANERKILTARIRQLEEMLKDNSELSLWTHTKDTGEVVAVTDMDSQELKVTLANTNSDHRKYLEAELATRED